MRQYKRWLLAGLALVVTAACASLGRGTFATPVVELKDVRVKGIGLQGGSLDVILDVYNPNNYRLDATKVTYTLFVDTNRVATGEITKLVTLTEHMKSEVVLPVSFTMQELLGAAKMLTGTGSVDYRVAGDVTVATPFGKFTRPYVGKGRYDSLRGL
jgi:LEA14-like dessication related protein